MILVVGGTGFVGKNLVVSLTARGVPVRVVSRSPNAAFLSEVAPSATALTTEQFLSDPQAALFGVDAVVYMASTSTPGSNVETPWAETQNTVEPAMRVMSAIVRHSQAHMVYLSSGGTVYGNVAGDVIPENSPLHPISPYGLGKKMTEAAIQFMAQTQGLRATILRPSNPIGRWQVSVNQGVVGALMRAARQGHAFPMIGEGSAVRDYFDVQDLVGAIEMSIAAPEQSIGQTWNVGSGRGVSVRGMLDLVQEISGHEIAIDYKPARSADVDRVVLDTTSIQSALGWAPRFELRQSLQNIWDEHSA